MEKPAKKITRGFVGQEIIVIPENIINRIKNNPLINSLYVTSIGYYPHAAHHFRVRKEGAKQFILIYCVEGKGTIELGGQTFRLTPNHFFIIPPHTTHRNMADQNDPWSIYWMHFTGAKAAVLYDRYRQYKESQMVHIPFQGSRKNFFEHIMDTLKKGYGKNIIEYVNITLWELLSSFIYADFFREIGHQTNDSGYISEVITFMQQSIDQSLTVDEMARQVNYSVPYFHSIFKEKTGFTPIHYFNQLKTQKACQYLSFTELNIKEISYKLGFGDPFYFSRVFKRMMSLSPSEYRRLYKSVQNE